MDDRLELVRNDPESEATFDGLVAVIAEEISTWAAMGGRGEAPEDAQNIAELAADAVLDAFVVRERPKEKPRSSWRKS